VPHALQASPQSTASIAARRRFNPPPSVEAEIHGVRQGLPPAPSTLRLRARLAAPASRSILQRSKRLGHRSMIWSGIGGAPGRIGGRWDLGMDFLQSLLPFLAPSLLGLRLLRRMKLKTTPRYLRIVTIKAHFAFYASRAHKVFTFPRGHGF